VPVRRAGERSRGTRVPIRITGLPGTPNRIELRYEDADGNADLTELILLEAVDLRNSLTAASAVEFRNALTEAIRELVYSS
jgi:hypothetical protein